MIRRLIFGAVGSVVLLLTTWGAVALLSLRSAAGGFGSAGLAECPNSPNCVATHTRQDDKRMDPLAVHEPAAEVLRKVRRVLEQMPGSRIDTFEPPYLHATFRTRWLHFVDDVEFWVDESAGLLHFRSASRLGYSDLGVNRRRMEDFRDRWKRQYGAAPSHDA